MRRLETQLNVGEENLRAPEDQSARFLNGSGYIGGEEMENGGNVGGIKVGSEEVRAEEGQSGEIGVGEALGFEEMDGGKDLVDGVGRAEPGLGIDDV